MGGITRRALLTTATASAALAPIAVPCRADTDLTAIPSDIVDKIKAWQEAHRASVRTTDAYAASLRVKPIDKAECDRCYDAMSAALKLVSPAREAMIMALWRV